MKLRMGIKTIEANSLTLKNLRSVIRPQARFPLNCAETANIREVHLCDFWFSVLKLKVFYSDYEPGRNPFNCVQ